jgi:hypothetical protein
MILNLPISYDKADMKKKCPIVGSCRIGGFLKASRCVLLNAGLEDWGGGVLHV